MIRSTYTLEINKLKYNIILEEKNVKRISIYVDDNSNVVVKGSALSKEKADMFIHKNIDWINRMIYKRSEATEEFYLDDVKNKKKVWILGKVYNVVVSFNQTPFIDNDNLYVNSSKLYDLVSVTFKLTEREIYKRFIYYSKIFNIKPEIKFKKMLSKHAYCKFNDNTIVFSINCVVFPIEVIDYIIVHEFCHFAIHNHSKSFYQLVETYMPDYLKRIEILKKYTLVYTA